jgi:hypothetical protein
MAEAIRCELTYARADRQFVVDLVLPVGATVREALLQALQGGLAASCPEIDAELAVLGIFGKTVPADRMVREGDRVEVYRPLAADPRSARLERVAAMRKRRK